MATYRAGNLIAGTTNERTGLTTTYLIGGTRFFETNTDDMWQWDGDSWNVIAGNTVTQTLSSKTITAPDINGGTADSLTSLSLRDENVAYDLIVQSNDASMGANRTLNLDVNNSTRTISFGGNITTTGDLNTAGAYQLTLTQTGNTNVTLPTTGTLATLAGSETFTNKTLTSPIITTPLVPFPEILRLTLLSPPDATTEGAFPVAAFATVISLTADPVAVTAINSFPLVSLREVIRLGVVIAQPVAIASM